MVKAAEISHCGFERILTGMSERGMADVVGETQGFGQIFVEAKRSGNRPANLSHFKTMGKANAIMISVRRHEYLSFPSQPTKRDRVNDAITIALKHVSRPAHFVPTFVI
jgi:hypothetical protein